MDKDISFSGLVERFLHTIFIGRRKMNVIFNFVENLLSLISHACDIGKIRVELQVSISRSKVLVWQWAVWSR